MATIKRPPWIRARLPAGKNYHEIRSILQEHRLHTVCSEALCPNIGECYNQRTATFLIMGNVCTRQCGFCAVKKGEPHGVDQDEPFRIAMAAKEMQLKHIVITSVTRDDIPYGGAHIYAATIQYVRKQISACTVEVLIPDFGGFIKPLNILLEARPDIVNHNLETVPRLYPSVRPIADYKRSLYLLKAVHKKNTSIITKSGLMLGMGERMDEVLMAMQDIRNAGCDIITLGQYLRPNKNALPIQRYYTPEEFEKLKKKGVAMGFKHIEAGPLVRSSYHAKLQMKGV